MPRLAASALALFLAAASFAASPPAVAASSAAKAASSAALIKDINRIPTPASSEPAIFASLGRVAVLRVTSASIRPGSVDLWRTDGTAAGTFALPICEQGCYFAPRLLAVVGPRAFIVLSPRINGEPPGDDELWVTDGTAAGTFQLATDLVVPAFDPVPAAAAASRGLVFFLASDEGHGTQLWRSDGTPAGTFRLTGLDNLGGSIAVLQGQAYFSADQGAVAGALFRSDGTVRGTVLVKDPLPQSPFGPMSLHTVGNRLVFLTARDSGQRLWCSDGTRRGTVLCGGASSDVTFFDLQRSYTTASGRFFYFVSVPEVGVDLAVTDGTPQGTRTLTQIHAPNAFPGDAANLFRPAGDGRSVYFLADDGVHGTEVWKSDGTPGGTRLVKDVCPGACSGGFHLGRSLGNRFFFSGVDEARGIEPWVTNGTPAGTRRIADLCPGACGSAAQFLSAAVGSRVPFITILDGAIQTWATDGTPRGTVQIATPAPGLTYTFLPFEAPAVGGALLGTGNDPEHGIELWRSDLTARGTRFVADLNAADVGGSHPFGFRMVGSTAYFFADDGLSGFELWKSDGTAAGTARLADAVPGPEPAARPAFDQVLGTDSRGIVYFQTLVSSFFGYAVWRTDGSAAGTFPLTEPGELRCDPVFAELGGRVYFVHGDPALGCELWSSDGTAAGTAVLDALPGPDGPNPTGLVVHQGALYFRAFDEHGQQLWRSDGTLAGTSRVGDLGEGFATLSDPVALGGRIYFTATNGPSPTALWSSDGTEAGTRVELPCTPAEGCRSLNRLYKAGDRLWLTRTNEPAGETVLLASDGTPGGTVVLAEANIFPANPPVPFQGKLYFSAIDGISGTQLWVSDGTPAGTHPLRGRRGGVVVMPDSFVHLGDRLAFLASFPGSNARFVWQTDGTQAGTFPLPGGIPQPLESAALVGTPERLYFPAGDDATGVELWGVTP